MPCERRTRRKRVKGKENLYEKKSIERIRFTR